MPARAQGNVAKLGHSFPDSVILLQHSAPPHQIYSISLSSELILLALCFCSAEQYWVSYLQSAPAHAMPVPRHSPGLNTMLPLMVTTCISSPPVLQDIISIRQANFQPNINNKLHPHTLSWGHMLKLLGV